MYESNESNDTDKYIKKGIEYYELGKFQDAIECFDYVIRKDSTIIRKDSTNVEAYTWKGLCLNYLGYYEDAKKCAEKAIEICEIYENANKRGEKAIEIERSDYAFALSVKAESLSYLGEAKKAIEFANKALNLLPITDCDRCYALIIKGYSYQYIGDYDKALEHINSAIDFGKHNNCDRDDVVDAYITKGIILNQLKSPEGEDIDSQLKRYKEAYNCFDTAIKKSSTQKYREQDIAYAFINSSISLLNLEKNEINDKALLDCYNNAITYSSECIFKNSKDAHAWMIKGVALFQLKFYDMAIECYDKIILDINCKFDFAWYLKGYTLNYLERYDEALKYFEQAIKINDKDIDYYIGKGISLYYLGRYNDAINCFNKALNLYQNLKKDIAYKDIILFSRGASYYANANQWILEALEDFKEIKDVNLIGQKCTNIGACYYKIGLYEDAKNKYHEAIEFNPKLVDAYYNLGVLNYNEGNVDTAKKLFESCLNTDNKFDKAREALEKLNSNLTDTSEWFKWWFSRGRGRKVFGITLIFSIFVFIGIIIAMTTITLISYNQNMALDNATRTSGNSSNTSDNKTDNQRDNQPRTSGMLEIDKEVISRALTVTTILIALLIVILLFPSIRRVKVGDIIELEKLEPVMTDTSIPKQMEPLFIKVGVGIQSY